MKPSRQQIDEILKNFHANKYFDVEKLCVTVTKEFPKHPFAWKVLAVVLKLTGRLNDSLIPSQKSVQLEPRDADAHNNLGIILQELNRLDEAEESLKKALTLRPEYAEAHYNLGITLKEQGRLIEAEASYKQAIKLKPNYSEALTNLGAILQELNRLDEAEESLKKALTLRPEYAEAHYNLGITLKEQGRLIEAEASYKQAIKLKPNYVQAYNNLGGVLKQRGRLEEAIISYNKAIELEPRYVEAHSNRNLCLNYLPSYSPLFIYKQHLEFEKQFGGLKVELPTILSFVKNTNYRLRIGYVSADFKEHSVAFFFEPLLKSHSSNVVETFCYYNDRVIDTTTRRLMATCDHWRSIYGLTDQNVVNLIRNDKIDILVDLSGHTAGNRLLVFIQKPSPVQVTWLGYPNTTGLSSVDYRFTDIISDPDGDVDNLYSETLLRLPNGFLCYQGNKNIQVDNVLPQNRHEQITFGSFNNVSKITSIVIKTWSKILHAIPTSRLVLKLPTLDNDTNKYHELFIEEGISKERIKFYQRAPSFEEHLSLYNIIDICLDPFPYNGTTTTCEALWMGVPVITLLGDRHAGRVGASILTNIGLKDFIANDIDNYIKLAVDMSNNTKYLQKIRRNLRKQMQEAPLCNAPSFASDVERVYQNIWYKYHQKQT